MRGADPHSFGIPPLAGFGVGASGAGFYDAHVEANEELQHIAAHDLGDGLGDLEPALRSGIVFGARALTHVERA